MAETKAAMGGCNRGTPCVRGKCRDPQSLRLPCAAPTHQPIKAGQGKRAFPFGLLDHYDVPAATNRAVKIEMKASSG